MLLTIDFASFVLVILLYSSLAFIYIYIYIYIYIKITLYLLSYIYCTNQIAAALLLVQFTPVEKFLGDFTIAIV